MFQHSELVSSTKKNSSVLAQIPCQQMSKGSRKRRANRKKTGKDVNEGGLRLGNLQEGVGLPSQSPGFFVGGMTMHEKKKESSIQMMQGWGQKPLW